MPPETPNGPLIETQIDPSRLYRMVPPTTEGFKLSEKLSDFVPAIRDWLIGLFGEHLNTTALEQWDNLFRQELAAQPGAGFLLEVAELQGPEVNIPVPWRVIGPGYDAAEVAIADYRFHSVNSVSLVKSGAVKTGAKWVSLQGDRLVVTDAASGDDAFWPRVAEEARRRDCIDDCIATSAAISKVRTMVDHYGYLANQLRMQDLDLTLRMQLAQVERNLRNAARQREQAYKQLQAALAANQQAQGIRAVAVALQLSAQLIGMAKDGVGQTQQSLDTSRDLYAGYSEQVDEYGNQFRTLILSGDLQAPEWPAVLKDLDLPPGIPMPMLNTNVGPDGIPLPILE